MPSPANLSPFSFRLDLIWDFIDRWENNLKDCIPQNENCIQHDEVLVFPAEPKAFGGHIQKHPKSKGKRRRKNKKIIKAPYHQ